MDFKQNEITEELHRQRENIQKSIEPFWYRLTRYNFPFCMVLFYNHYIDEEECRHELRKTDSYIKLDENIACIFLEALDISTAVTLLERILYTKENQYNNSSKEFYASLVCSSQVKEEEELINKSFMILEYAFEYKRRNEILDFGILPSSYGRQVI